MYLFLTIIRSGLKPLSYIYSVHSVYIKYEDILQDIYFQSIIYMDGKLINAIYISVKQVPFKKFVGIKVSTDIVYWIWIT